MNHTVDRWRQDLADRAKAVTPLEVRRALVKARLTSRRTTARWRQLPDVLIIGAQRSGTSSLYKWLGRHPSVVASLRKEIEYFSTDFTQGEEWYRAHFPLALRVRAAAIQGRSLITFEDTPDYLLDPRAPERARTLVPEAKLIALLRDPVRRAISHYFHNVRLGIEPLGLAEALRAEDDRLAGEWDRIADDPSYHALPLRRFSYVTRGRYAEQLERWLQAYPRRNLLVLRSEDLYARPGQSFRRILDFLGLPAWEPAEFRNYTDYDDSQDGYPEEPPDAVRRFVADRLAEPNRHLVALLGDDFSWSTPEIDGSFSR